MGRVDVVADIDYATVTVQDKDLWRTGQQHNGHDLCRNARDPILGDDVPSLNCSNLQV